MFIPGYLAVRLQPDDNLPPRKLAVFLSPHVMVNAILFSKTDSGNEYD
jgi:hypothetical protein